MHEVDVSAFEETPAGAATPMRDDVVQPPLDREQVARNAPRWADGFFIVPKVIGDE
ncbi:MAG TPA: Asp-tRNA(Asn)/Glu-tRNA(Gln) amidotransferase subunit GatC [Thermoanaerobaculia bacterium]|nr:Asp-tRNA(Asn)/Glu-tRNA(Gln) amidotransferase subunit GatC [Thermoanaerobaculia bacterium]